MFRCPSCHNSTISLFQRIAASDPAYPATCSKCKGESVTDQSMLGSFALVEAPALALIGLLWFVTGNLILASQIAMISALALLPASLFFVPLRAVQHQRTYPAPFSNVTDVKSVFGPVSYVIFLVVVFGVFLWGSYVLVLLEH